MTDGSPPHEIVEQVETLELDQVVAGITGLEESCSVADAADRLPGCKEIHVGKQAARRSLFITRRADEPASPARPPVSASSGKSEKNDGPRGPPFSNQFLTRGIRFPFSRRP
jgi:hypothetical protein